MNVLLRTAAVMLAGFTAFLSLYAPQPLLPTLARVFGVSAAKISVSITMGTLGMALASPLAGALSDRLGRRRLIIVAAFALAVCSALSALAPVLPLFLAMRFLLGVFTPGVVAVTVAYIHEEWAVQDSGRAISAYVAGTIIGGFAGRFLAGLIAAAAPWTWVFLVLGAINFFCAVALWLWLPKETHRPLRAAAGGWPAVATHLRNGKLLAAYGVGFCVLFTLTSSFTYINFYLAERPYSLTPAQLGALFLVYPVGAGVTLIAGRAIDRVGHRATLAVAVACGACGMLLTLLPALPVIVLGLGLCASGVFAAQASTSSFLGLATDRDRALAIGLYGTFYYGGGAAGAAVPGLLWHSYGWTGCVLLIAAVQLLTIALALRLWPAKMPHSSFQPPPSDL